VLVAAGACTDAPERRPERPTSPPPTVETTASWRQLAPALSQRTEVAAAAAGTRIVVVGGYRADGGTVASTEILDTTSGEWSAGPDLPVAVNHAMAANIDGAVFVFGGYLPNQRPSAAVFRLDGAAWRAVAPMPQPRAAATAVAQGGLAYVAAGIGPDGLAGEMLVYDPATDRWSTAPGPPTRREHLGGAGFGGLVYTVGGRTGGLNTNLPAFEAFDPRTRRWTVLPDLPTRRGGLAATATCAGQIVAAGGEATTTFREVEVFDIAAGSWKSLPPSPTPRHGLGVVALGNTVYTLSGGPRPGLHVADTTEALDLGGACR
jgi:non-specific serine/threonine protein kinase